MLWKMLWELAFDITLQNYKWAGDYRKVSAIQVVDVYFVELQSKSGTSTNFKDVTQQELLKLNLSKMLSYKCGYSFSIHLWWFRGYLTYELILIKMKHQL